jgi:2-amino-4-hydroxy-6-hydroxymethyldihydropteridine diphosphokinase
MKKTYIAFGSNVGKREKHLQVALQKLAVSDGITLLRVSPLYETEPVGGPKQKSFYNGVVELMR